MMWCRFLGFACNNNTQIRNTLVTHDFGDGDGDGDGDAVTMVMVMMTMMIPCVCVMS